MKSCSKETVKYYKIKFIHDSCIIDPDESPEEEIWALKSNGDEKLVFSENVGTWRKRGITEWHNPKQENCMPFLAWAEYTFSKGAIKELSEEEVVLELL